MSEQYHAESVGARGLTLRKLLREMVPNAAWSGVQYVIGIIFAGGAGILFRHWITMHWFWLVAALVVFSAAIFGAFRAAVNVGNRVVRSELQPLRAALDEVYADCVFAWLKENIRGKGFFRSQVIAERLDLGVEDVIRGLELLRDKYDVVQGAAATQWRFEPEKAILLDPRFRIDTQGRKQ
jgi:uncharacterized membrane protein